MPASKRIGEMLIDAGLITSGQLDEALKTQQEQGGKVVETLIALGYLDARTFTAFLAKQRGIPSIDLSQYEVPDELVKLIPREVAQKAEVFPVDKMGSLLTVAMVCPLDTQAIASLQESTGLRIKPLLCRAEEIRGAINRYYGLDAEAQKAEFSLGKAGGAASSGLTASLKLSSTVRLIRKITSLPALPETVERVREATVDMDVSIQDVARVIKRDPAIAAKILSVANSAAYGFPNQVDSVDLAVSLMGLRETYSIVLAASVADVFKKSKAFDYRAFWKQSARAAVAALVVGPACSKVRRSALYAGALLHQLGRVALVEVAPELCTKIDQDQPIEKLIEDEEAVMGIGHPEAGFELASHWGLPNEIGQAIRYYNRPADAETAHELAAIINIAHAMSQAQAADDTRVYQGLDAVFGMLKLEEAKVAELLADYFEKRDSLDFVG